MRIALLSLVTLASCGNVTSGADGAPTDDVDGSPGQEPDGQAGDGSAGGGVSIEVRTELGDGLPDLGASVLVMNDDGTVLYDALVDAAGKVEVDLTGTGWVTVRRVVEPQAGVRNVRMTTIRGVEPGDELVFGRGLRPGTQFGADRSRTFSYTPFGSVPHTFYTPCGNRYIGPGGATTGTIDVLEGCAPETFDFLAVADFEGQSPQYVYLPGQTRSATTTIVVPLPWTAMNTVTATYTNVTAGMEYLATTRDTLLDEVPVYTNARGVPDPSAGGTFQQQLPYAAGVGSGATYRIALGSDATGERQTVFISTAAPTSTLGYDFATLALPRLLQIPAITVDGASWTETSTPHESDERLVVWRATFAGSGLTTTIDWNVIDGERSSSMTLPTLPPSYAEFDPRQLPGFAPAGAVFVYYVDCDVLDGYAAARPLNTNLVDAVGELRPALGSDYRCRLSESPYNDP